MTDFITFDYLFDSITDVYFNVLFKEVFGVCLIELANLIISIKVERI